MVQDDLSRWIVSCLILGLRIAPVFAFAPPFSLVRMPKLFQLLFGLGASVALISAYPEAARAVDTSVYGIIAAALRELALGTMFVLAFHAAFGMLYLAGRTIDVQAGFGFALLVDPKSQAQVPLTGTLFAYGAGLAFFSANGHLDLLKLLASSLDAIPLGQWSLPASIVPLCEFLSVASLLAFGIAGIPILTMFLLDLVIALLSRTVPQMNVLVLGFQVKTLALLAVLPVSLGLGGALLLRMMNLTLQSLPRMI
jgi:flagellar biosynthetic protein FliR